MRMIYTDTISGPVSVPVYFVSEIPYTEIMLEARESRKHKISYLEIPCAFDIETTNIKSDPEGRITDFGYSDVFNHLKNLRIKYNDRIVKSIPDFEKDIRRKYFGKLHLSKKTGSGIDTQYVELADTYPDFFPESITDPAQQLQQIIDIYDQVAPDRKKFRPFAYMYHWQFCIGFRVIFGRTWEDFQSMLRMIEKRMNLSKNLRLVIYVHNLSFEMQFMRRFLHVTDSFCKDDRGPLKIVHDGCIEFRCSQALSNMTLQMFCKAENARFYKLSDTYDYEKIRTAETVLTPKEESYCYNDVRGLCECIQSLMRYDTLASIPLTSTGYVRREARKALKANKANRRIFTDSALSAEDYKHMRQAFRGGDTHAAARYSNSDDSLKDVYSYDIASSYPACMMINEFPMSKFVKIKMKTFKKLRARGGWCFLLHVALLDIRCTASHGIPYIALAKTSHYSKDRILDNGRILAASEVILWVTDIDMDIIMQEYKIGSMRIESIYCARAARLPEEYRAIVMDYFRKKTQLKTATDPEGLYMYGKSKNRINSLYGMMCMRLDQSDVIYTGEGDSGYIEQTKPLEEVLAAYYKKRSSFLAYQWGVWVTAHARKRLHDMMSLIGRDLVYIDTDSVKILHIERHQAAIDEHNEKLRKEAEAAGAFADDPEGIRHYLGVFEFDGHYDEFRTLGAKKYVVRIGDQCYSTIAGVSKKAGQKFFNDHGINAFRIGAVVENSGHLVAYYNDDPIHTITIDGCTMTTAANLALIDDTYTIGVTDDYVALLEAFKNGIYYSN